MKNTATPAMTRIPEGFTPHNGGTCPVDGDTMVELIYRGGTPDIPSNERDDGLAGRFVWGNVPNEPELDIIAYRVISAPTQPDTVPRAAEIDEALEAGYDAMRNPADNMPASWIVLGTARNVYEAMERVLAPARAREEAALHARIAELETRCLRRATVITDQRARIDTLEARLKEIDGAVAWLVEFYEAGGILKQHFVTDKPEGDYALCATALYLTGLPGEKVFAYQKKWVPSEFYLEDQLDPMWVADFRPLYTRAQPAAQVPDDIRAQGWVVAVHNDYRLNGEAHTFWLFTKDDRCIKGEGRNDAAALNAVRAAMLAAAPKPEMTPAQVPDAERQNDPLALPPQLCGSSSAHKPENT